MSEETKTMSPRRRSSIAGHERPDQPVRADHGEVELAGEPLRVDLGDRARARPRRRCRPRPRCRRGPAATALANAATESSSVRSSGCATASPPSARICGGDLLEPVRTARAERDREAGPSPGRAPWPRRCRSEAPVTTAGRRSGWAYFVARPSAHRHPGRHRGEPAHVDRVHPHAARRGRPRPSGPARRARSARSGPRAGPGWRRGRSAGRRRRTGSAASSSWSRKMS